MNKNQDQNSQSTPSGHPSQTEQALPDTNPVEANLTPKQEEFFEPVVFTYTRKEALADGVQVDVSTTAAEAGIRVPVFLTHGVYSQYVQVPEGVTGQDEAGRLWDVIWMTRHAILKSRRDARRITVELYVRNSEGEGAQLVTLAAEIGAVDFDDLNPAITVMELDED